MSKSIRSKPRPLSSLLFPYIQNLILPNPLSSSTNPNQSFFSLTIPDQNHLSL
ncbi:hypothetical protein RchiOBHm_Chr4g0429771 [Rosa chinensis]|uniref:Uncharacterized protein n=1 Tax=Rosa chinensis TaxID=74649 RepID=A0A2P6R095_ROSCH|nr:hypothetical protein RchiOBHm_Chr4g0429771 [Rosa chinensis]